MKIEGFDAIEINQKGRITITPENVEDFWALANIIRVGDKLFSQIRRKITKVSSTGKTDSKNILTKAGIRVVEIDYQANVDEMNLRGTLLHDVEDARLGSFQRVLIRIGSPFSLQKKCWDKFSYEELREAANPISDATVSAIIMQLGLAHICIVGRNTTVVTSKVTKVIPKIKAAGSGAKAGEAKAKFFEQTASTFLRDVPINEMKCVIIASPGFLAHEFYQYLAEHQNQYQISSAFSAQKFIEATVPSGYPQELENLLAQPSMQAHVAELKAATQAKAIDLLLHTLNDNPEMIKLGESVIPTIELGAVKTLMVTDDYIRSQELEPRLKFLEMKDNLEKNGAEVIVFSTRHQSGTRLKELGGLAAILRFAIALDDVDQTPDLGFDD